MGKITIHQSSDQAIHVQHYSNVLTKSSRLTTYVKGQEHDEHIDGEGKNEGQATVAERPEDVSGVGETSGRKRGIGRRDLSRRRVEEQRRRRSDQEDDADAEPIGKLGLGTRENEGGGELMKAAVEAKDKERERKTQKEKERKQKNEKQSEKERGISREREREKER